MEFAPPGHVEKARAAWDGVVAPKLSIPTRFLYLGYQGTLTFVVESEAAAQAFNAQASRKALADIRDHMKTSIVKALKPVAGVSASFAMAEMLNAIYDETLDMRSRLQTE